MTLVEEGEGTIKLDELDEYKKRQFNASTAQARKHTLLRGVSGLTGSSTASNMLLIKMTAKMKSSKYRRFTSQ